LEFAKVNIVFTIDFYRRGIGAVGGDHGMRGMGGMRIR
jgi:hypothetical protein